MDNVVNCIAECLEASFYAKRFGFDRKDSSSDLFSRSIVLPLLFRSFCFFRPQPARCTTRKALATKHDAQTFMLPRRHRLWKPATSSQNVEASSHPRFAYQAQNHPSLQQKAPTNNRKQALAFLTMSGAHWSVREKHRLQPECFVWTHLCCLVQRWSNPSLFLSTYHGQREQCHFNGKIASFVCWFATLLLVVGCQRSELPLFGIFVLPFLSTRS